MNTQLRIDIHGYWYTGTGRTSGSHVDSLVEKDEHGLPYLNGRHLKGLLRDAIARAAQWGWFDEIEALPVSAGELESWLFGSRNAVDEDDSSRFTTHAGSLFISNAQLPQADQIALRGQPLRKGLYRNLFSTAIDVETGTAKDQSLRGIEVVIPLTLYAELTLQGPSQSVQAAYEVLEKSITLIDYVGGMRNKGMGRATLSLIQEGSKVA
ncbi:MAG: hypothetical protein CSA51_01580 [Gammaproteobacteria bacterium]|nr:MAG: hypothetical protein CSA51_01580 [Gammaproteobacteria bacterium]